MKLTKEDVVAYSMYAIMFALIMVMALSGCATFNRIVTNDALVSQLAVEAATARVLYEHPMWRGQTATITSAAMSAIDSKTTVNLADIQAFVEVHISWSSLLPEEQALVSTLISQVRQNLEDSFRAHGVVDTSSQLIQVRQVLQWINHSAKRQ